MNDRKLREREHNQRVLRAHLLAMFVHDGQVDQAGNPYMRHVNRVADHVYGPEDKVVAYLHDTVEDGPDPYVILALIEAVFGTEVAEAVEALTHRPHEPVEDYYERVRANETALRVKRADVADNANERRLALVEPVTAERLRAKYEKATRLLAGEASE